MRHIYKHFDINELTPGALCCLFSVYNKESDLEFTNEYKWTVRSGDDDLSIWLENNGAESGELVFINVSIDDDIYIKRSL